MLVLLAPLAGCSGGRAWVADWKRSDQWQMGYQVACQAIDWRQTEWGLANGYREGNPLIGDGSDTIGAVKLGAVAFAYVAGEGCGPYRTFCLATVNVLCTAAVVHNYSEGARP